MPEITPRILALWSAPRSRSTAFLRMMMERGDYMVLHEPFSHVADFGETTVGSIVVHSERELILAIRNLALRTPVFFKDTTDFLYSQLLLDNAFLRDATHTFIIRHPADVIASHHALNPFVNKDEIGIARLAEIYDAVRRQNPVPPVIIDSDDLAAMPGSAVRAYCEAVGIPYMPNALSWKPGIKKEWERTHRWHEMVISTDGFVRAPRTYPVNVYSDPRLAEYFRYHLPFYERMHNHKLIVPGSDERVSNH